MSLMGGVECGCRGESCPHAVEGVDWVQVPGSHGAIALLRAAMKLRPPCARFHRVFGQAPEFSVSPRVAATILAELDGFERRAAAHPLSALDLVNLTTGDRVAWSIGRFSLFISAEYHVRVSPEGCEISTRPSNLAARPSPSKGGTVRAAKEHTTTVFRAQKWIEELDHRQATLRSLDSDIVFKTTRQRFFARTSVPRQQHFEVRGTSCGPERFDELLAAIRLVLRAGVARGQCVRFS